MASFLGKRGSRTVICLVQTSGDLKNTCSQPLPPKSLGWGPMISILQAAQVIPMERCSWVRTHTPG